MPAVLTVVQNVIFVVRSGKYTKTSHYSLCGSTSYKNRPSNINTQHINHA